MIVARLPWERCVVAVHALRLLVGAYAVALTSAAGAHEFWILPDRFTAAPGSEVAFALRVGAGWPGEAFPRQPQRIVRFDLVDAEGVRPIEGGAGAEPAGIARVRAAGVAIAVYRSNPASIALEPALFERYLHEEGLEAIVALRAARGQSALPARERYSRAAKSIVAIGAGPAAPRGFDRALGLTLELIPERLPSRLRPGDVLGVRLLHLGRPLAGALVRALPQSAAQAPVSARSDAAGRLRLRLDTPGVWLLNAVHMVEAAPESGADWESIWSTLTFEIPADPGRRFRAPRPPS